MVEFCEKREWELIVVNDASEDNTKNVLESFQKKECLNIYNHKVNRGYGGAIKTGIAESTTKYVITIDADGQHILEDVDKLYNEIVAKDAEMVVGSRKGLKSANWYRDLGKELIRIIAKMLMPIKIYDINSGMKIYDANLAKRYIGLCPDSMAYSDIITLVFISQYHLVTECPISINPRISGKSTIGTQTAFETVKEILNIVVLFNPLRIFFLVSIICILFGIAWGLPIVLRGDGVSVGSMLAIVTGLIFFFLGLLAEQLSLIRKSNIN